jgi:hypothetical protein
MGFKPVYLGFADYSIGKLHGCSSFPFAPAPFAVRAFQIAPDVDPSARGDCLDVSNLAEDLEFHQQLSTLYLFVLESQPLALSGGMKARATILVAAEDGD